MTDDRGAAALAERLHFTHDRGDDCNRARHEAQATAILGEHGRFLADGWPSGSLAELMELRAEVERLSAAIEQGRWRALDLVQCNKDDQCHIKGEGALLVVEDIEAALSPEPVCTCGPWEIGRPQGHLPGCPRALSPETER